MLARSWKLYLLAAVLSAGLLGGAVYIYLAGRFDAPALRAHVRGTPPVPVVFTSRSEPASLSPAAPEGEGFRYPGQLLWAAREGRLRLLTTSGRVQELTWGRTLPDGTTLIDVMSPSVSADGQKIFFAGRKGSPDPGHFRLYEVGVDGGGLRQLTGGPDDAGASAAPPMRYPAGEGTDVLPPDERRRVDYDDIDPTDAGHNRLVFASSRVPDLGRGHARRATMLWEMDLNRGPVRSISSNRNNDRWPYHLSTGSMVFSLWSRNTEVVTADGKDIRPMEEGERGLTGETDSWLGAIIDLAPNPRLSGLVKTPEPVWRPRPLFRNRIVFMTWKGTGLPRFDRPEDLGALRVLQAPPGLMENAPSSHPSRSVLPTFAGSNRFWGPTKDLDGLPLALATPSPCPDAGVLLAGAPTLPGQPGPAPGQFGIYLASDDWPAGEGDAASVHLQLLFDDPALVDAEPAAVYARRLGPHPLNKPDRVPTGKMTLLSGRLYEGPVATFLGARVYDAIHDGALPQKTDAGQGPIFGPSARGAIREIRVFASYRDRFDDPAAPRIVGGWERLVSGPMNQELGNFRFEAPSIGPVVLAGFDGEGRVAQWTNGAKDGAGRQARSVAYAGDHYSGIRPGGFHFCTGCHTGHSILDTNEHREKRR
ncbi:MAG: hypothetical protein ACRC33_18675 [Gemmataceae bacterium]